MKIYMARANFMGGGAKSLVGEYLRKFAAQLREGAIFFWGGGVGQLRHVRMLMKYNAKSYSF
jgi:hypothetical protein